MSDHEPGRHDNRHARLRSEILGEWENEGGSLWRPFLTHRTGASAGPADPGFALLDTLPLGVLVTNCDGKITYSNPAAEKLFDASASKLLGTPWWQAIDERDLSSLPVGWQKDSDTTQPRTFELRLITPSGRRIWTRHSIASLAHQPASANYIHTIEDISGIKAAERARQDALDVLSRERERARVTLECIGDAVISTDAGGQVTFMNSVAEHLTGWTREKADGLPLTHIFKVIDSDTGETIVNPAELAMESLEVVNMPANSLLSRSDGGELAIEDSAAPILDIDGRLTGAVVIFRDRRLSRENTERMSYLARHDALTGLPNRVAFAEHFDQAIKLAQRHQKRVGLLFIDLDHFKQVNDSLGHRAGDRVLRDLARKLAGCIRNTDLICRHGGDEFVVLLSEIRKADDAGMVAAKMRAVAAKFRHSQGHKLALELSIGISLYPEDGADLDTLMHRADAAMYHAKIDKDKDYCFYQAGMERTALEFRFDSAPSLYDTEQKLPWSSCSNGSESHTTARRPQS